MKKYINRVILAAVLVIGFSIKSSAQLVVSVRPSAPVIVRPIAPSPRHVWVEGNWQPRRGHYEYAQGYWSAPRRGYHYVPGYWASRPHGHVWIEGRWCR